MRDTRLRLATLTMTAVLSLLATQYPAGAMTSVEAVTTVLG